jgi:hypothetical protein
VRRILPLTALTLALAAGATQAAEPARAQAPIKLARPVAFATAEALPPGVAKTSLAYRPGGRSDVIGELGFLCGREAGQGRTGAAAARGYDPSGRFVGAKLRLSF